MTPTATISYVTPAEGVTTAHNILLATQRQIAGLVAEKAALQQQVDGLVAERDTLRACLIDATGERNELRHGNGAELEAENTALTALLVRIKRILHRSRTCRPGSAEVRYVAAILKAEDAIDRHFAQVAECEPEP